MKSTYMARPADIERKWYVVDAEGQTLGRLATQVAAVLRGKHKPTFTPHMDTGDHVIVINAEKVVLTGNKLQQKEYQRYSMHPGGLKRIKYVTLMATRPELAVEHAVKGMLPHNKLGRQIAKKLQVYGGPEHPHAAQCPVPMALGE